MHSLLKNVYFESFKRDVFDTGPLVTLCQGEENLIVNETIIHRVQRKKRVFTLGATLIELWRALM